MQLPGLVDLQQTVNNFETDYSTYPTYYTTLHCTYENAKSMLEFLIRLRIFLFQIVCTGLDNT